jgi:hypothetical protein
MRNEPVRRTTGGDAGGMLAALLYSSSSLITPSVEGRVAVRDTVLPSTTAMLPSFSGTATARFVFSKKSC